MPHTLSAGALEMAQTLVSLDTASSRGNLALIDFARGHLARFGVRSRLSYNVGRTKANLFATLGAGKPDGVILAGHTDTVPWEGQDWSVDPLSGTVQDWPVDELGGEVVQAGPRLYGRGAADMKGFIAVALASARHILESDPPFAVHLALSYDAEAGGAGVRELIADMRDAGIEPRACIVGEPTGMVPVIAHKGVYRYRCRVRGRAGHSAYAPGSGSAVDVALRLAGRLREMAERLERHGVHDPGFDVPFSTIGLGAFHAATADGVVPGEAVFRYELRNLPQDDAALLHQEVTDFAAELEGVMKVAVPEARISFETLCEIPPFVGTPDDTAMRLVQRLGGEAASRRMAFGSEAGLYQAAGIPTAICGPGHVTQAHEADEYVTLEQLARCEAFVHRLAAATHL